MNVARTTSRTSLYASLGLLGVLLVLFGDVLLTPRNVLISHPNCDGRDYFSVMRAFAANEILHGRLPLWNPYVFCGTPFLAGFQSTLLYPPNLIYVVLPLAKAMNVEVALHVYLCGLFMFLWARYRGLHGFAAFLCAAALMCCGPFWLRAMPGHITMIDALAWAPLAFLAADKVLDSGRWSWAFVGSISLALPIYAGHPQVFFSTCFALALYVVARWLANCRNIKTIAPLALLFCAAPVLGAAQLWPSLDVARETVRALGMPYKIATTFSFPPENFITLFAPTFFGDYAHTPYVGRWVLWEASAYVGVGVLALALLGAWKSTSREKKISVILIAVFAVIALGRYTPIYQGIFQIPGFSGFRGPGRFMFYAALFLCLLAGDGAHQLLAGATRPRWFAWIMAAGSLALLVAAVGMAIGSGDGGAWEHALKARAAHGDVWYQITYPLIIDSGHNAQIALYAAFAITLFFACILELSGKRRAYAGLFVSACVLELLVVARVCRSTYDLDAVRLPALDDFLRTRVGDNRVWDLAGTNYVMQDGAANVWGYDPVTLMRYTDFMARTQEKRVEETLHEIPFRHYSPAFRILRCKYVVDSRDEEFGVREMPDALPRFALFDSCEIVRDKERMFSELLNPTFNGKARLLLETAPIPAPEPGGGEGTIQLLREDTDSMELSIDVPKAAVLLVTDAYCSGWRAIPLEDSSQREYTIQPADYVLRAVPLAAGHHHIRMEYAPEALTYGVWSTLVGGAIFFVAWLFVWRRERAVAPLEPATA